MSSNQIISSQANRKRVIVIALDGVPYSFFSAMNELKLSPFLSALYNSNKIYSMTTTLPPVSFSNVWILPLPIMPIERQNSSPKITIRSGATPLTSG